MTESQSITSRRNPLIVETASLKEKKYRDRTGLFLAEGTVLLSEALLSGVIPQRIFVTPEGKNRLPSQLPDDVDVIGVTDEVYQKLSTEDAPEGVMSVFARFEQEVPSHQKGGALVLEQLQDPGNVGTVIRTAAALGISRVILCGCADCYSPKALRASMGALFRLRPLRLNCVEEAAQLLKKEGKTLCAAVLDPDSVPLTQAPLPAECAVFIGNEGHGLSQTAKALCDEKRIIPMLGMESLNAAVAAAIFLWEMKKSSKGDPCYV